MTIRSWHQGTESNINGERRLKGGFVPNAAAAPAIKYGVGFTVGYVGVGIWLVTTDEPWAHFLGGSLSWQVESGLAHDGALTWGAVSRANKTVQILNRAAGVLANVAASGQLRNVWFELVTARNNITGINGLTT